MELLTHSHNLAFVKVNLCPESLRSRWRTSQARSPCTLSSSTKRNVRGLPHTSHTGRCRSDVRLASRSARRLTHLPENLLLAIATPPFRTIVLVISIAVKIQYLSTFANRGSYLLPLKGE